MNDEKSLADPKSLFPSQFMRARRPYLYSDSRVTQESHLAKEVFEYYLDTLTSRKEELKFEHFCRRIAEREICPNLIPQTGPTGGGDSKVDSETYPVADEIAIRWYEGIGREASQERWAFAFSAKKDWRSKLNSDVKKIIETRRNYSLIYFITNQFVSDRQRSSAEDDLGKKFHVLVRVLDRQWIVTKIYEHKLLPIAIETLEINDCKITNQKKLGPQDYKNEADLEKLESQIKDPQHYVGVDYQLVNDCLEAALLARSLEKPRVEVEGRFDRAQRIADRLNITKLQLKVKYNRAWTVYWWYDDFNELNKLYNDVENLACGSDDAEDLEKLSNLWQGLFTSVSLKRIEPQLANLSSRTEKLKTELRRVIAIGNRPSNSLRARTILLLMQLSENLNNNDELSKLFSELEDVLSECKSLLEYPLEPLTEIIMEMGDVIHDNESFYSLFDHVVNLTAERKSEVSAGQLLLKRGYQELCVGKKYQAIRLFGKASQMLAKREYRKEFIEALLGCAAAYESAGLLWAARANLLMATSQVLTSFREDGELNIAALVCLNRLIWIELQLGRVLSCIEWLRMANLLAFNLMLNDNNKEKYLEERNSQDTALAILLLKTDNNDAKFLELLPSILNNLALSLSFSAFLYLLGHEKFLRSEGIISSHEDSQTVQKYFWEYMNMSEFADLPDAPNFMNKPEIQFNSFVLGIEIIVKVERELSAILLAETILAALESLLSTSIKRILPHCEKIMICIKALDSTKSLFDWHVDEDGPDLTFRIYYPRKITDRLSKEITDFNKRLIEFIIDLVIRSNYIEDPQLYFEDLALNESALGRMLNFTNSITLADNVTEKNLRFEISAWEKYTDGKRFQLVRDRPWYFGLTKNVDNDASALSADSKKTIKLEDLFGIDNLKHRDIKIISIINVSQWNKAGWIATAFEYSAILDEPPFLILLFKNAKAAKTIFQGWHSKIGKIDKEERLHISIIRKINRSEPFSYRVLVQANPKFQEENKSSGIFLQISRIHTMIPSDSRNLELFSLRYNRIGQYYLLPGYYNEKQGKPVAFHELSIEKKQLRICDAWELHENDPDIVALQPGDSPIIPENIEDPPVMRALKKLAEFRDRKLK